MLASEPLALSVPYSIVVPCADSPSQRASHARSAFCLLFSPSCQPVRLSCRILSSSDRLTLVHSPSPRSMISVAAHPAAASPLRRSTFSITIATVKCVLTVKILKSLSHIHVR